jgi:hypothetical protein
MAKKSTTVENLSALDQSQIKRAEKQEDTRSRIANIFVIGYLLVLALLIGLTAWGKLSADSAKDYLLAIGSPLGFIIGFYFKSSEK